MSRTQETLEPEPLADAALDAVVGGRSAALAAAPVGGHAVAGASSGESKQIEAVAFYYNPIR